MRLFVPPQLMLQWRHYVIALSVVACDPSSSVQSSVRAKMFLSFLLLHVNTGRISLKFGGGSNHYREQIKWLHFGRYWNRNEVAGYDRIFESMSTVLLRCQSGADV